MSRIKKLIVEKQFQKASILFDNDKSDKTSTQIELDTNEYPSQEYYDFMIFLGKNSEQEKSVYFSSMILATSLCSFKDAYKEAYNLAKNLVKINGNDIDNWEWLLFFYDLPDKVMTHKELQDVLINIFKIDRNNQKATNFLNNYFTKEEKSFILSKVI